MGRLRNVSEWPGPGLLGVAILSVMGLGEALYVVH